MGRLRVGRSAADGQRREYSAQTMEPDNIHCAPASNLTDLSIRQSRMKLDLGQVRRLVRYRVEAANVRLWARVEDRFRPLRTTAAFVSDREPMSGTPGKPTGRFRIYSKRP
jgi:hypothetical protein